MPRPPPQGSDAGRPGARREAPPRPRDGGAGASEGGRIWGGGHGGRGGESHPRGNQDLPPPRQGSDAVSDRDRAPASPAPSKGGGSGRGAQPPSEEIKDVRTPFSDADVESLKAGDRVRISGVIYTARDAAHARLLPLIEKREALPIDVTGQIIYYTGPSPARPGTVIGSVGPTTASRMDKFTPSLLKLGLKGTIGKGYRGQPVKDALKQYKAIYFGAIGGAGAVLSEFVRKAEVVAYEDLGTEAIRRLEVDAFPAIVLYDCHGGDLYQDGQKVYAREDPYPQGGHK